MGNPIDTTLDFRDATRQQAKASILIEGLTGKGKSGLALLLGKAFAAGDLQKVYAIDTENKSLDLFEGNRFSDGVLCTPFKKVDLLSSRGYAPSNYLLCKENAIKAGGLVMINDSITHMWQREGGLLELVNTAQKQNSKLNNYTAWGDPKVKAEKEAIFSTIRDSRIHVISTVRVKEKFEIVTEASGKSGLKSQGEQQQQMPDLKYEPDLVLHMVKAGTTAGEPPVAMVVKSRYVLLSEGIEYAFTEDLVNSLVEYLQDGADPAELLEKQRLSYVETITNILNEDVRKRTMFPALKEQMGVTDTPLAELQLKDLQVLLSIVLS